MLVEILLKLFVGVVDIELLKPVNLVIGQKHVPSCGDLIIYRLLKEDNCW